MLRTFSLKQSILGFVLLAVVLLAGVGGVAIHASRAERANLDLIAHDRLPKAVLVGHLRMNNHAILRFIWTAQGFSGQAADRKKYLEMAGTRIEQFKTDFEKLQKFAFEGKTGEEFAKIPPLWRRMVELFPPVISALDEQTNEGDRRAKTLLATELAPLSGQLVEILKTCEDNVLEKNTETVASAESQASTYTITILAAIVVGMGILLTLGLMFATSLARGLGTVARHLSHEADSLAEAAQQIASASNQLMSAATEQSAALEQTSASIEETSSMVAKNADNAQKSATISTNSQGVADKGKAAVEAMIGSIHAISQSNAEIMAQIERSNGEISEIVTLIAEIGNKTKVINDIVFQTKLLSFNASVEAARAGEQGKGFAVVAEEVGKLAQMSGNSAQEISTMLADSIQKVEGIVANTKMKVERLIAAGTERVQAGSLTAQRCGDVLEEVVHNVAQVGTMVGEIASASQEQSRGIQEINRAVGQLQQVAEHNSAASAQASSSADTMRSQVSALRAMVADLNLTIHGAAAHAEGGDVARLQRRSSTTAARRKRAA